MRVATTVCVAVTAWWFYRQGLVLDAALVGAAAIVCATFDAIHYASRRR